MLFSQAIRMRNNIREYLILFFSPLNMFSLANTSSQWMKQIYICILNNVNARSTARATASYCCGKYNYPRELQYFTIGFVEPSVTFCVSIPLITMKNHIWKRKAFDMQITTNPFFSNSPGQWLSSQNRQIEALGH